MLSYSHPHRVLGAFSYFQLHASGMTSPLGVSLPKIAVKPAREVVASQSKSSPRRKQTFEQKQSAPSPRSTGLAAPKLIRTPISPAAGSSRDVKL
jgi:hypothetical protein